MPRNIFVLGLDDMNRPSLETLPGARDYEFYQLLVKEELQEREEIPFESLLRKATSQLEGFEDRIDAIVGYGDFPISSMAPILCERFGLPSASLEREVVEVGGETCIAEEAVAGRQLTIEGFASGEVFTHGVVDSITCEGISSFERFQYPSGLPDATKRRVADIATRVIKQIGIDRSCFNIEFFWEEDTDELYVLEVNPRHSQSHAKLFEYVDGVPNHKLMVELALGEQPTLEHGHGEYAIAAKWFMRAFEDGVVTRSPTPEEVTEVEQAVPGTAIQVVAEEGARLSELHDQDSYSFKLANIYIGADSEEQLAEKYRRCADALPLTVEKR